MYYLSAFVVGAAHVVYYSRIPSPGMLLAIAIVVWLLWVYFRRSFAIAITGCFLAGMATGSQVVQQRIEAQLSPQHEGESYHIRFAIESIPVVSDFSISFMADVLSSNCQHPACPSLVGQRLRLGWFQPEGRLRAGQIWEAEVVLKRPRGLANPGGFDYQGWLVAQNVIATGYVRRVSGWRGTQHNLAYWRQTVRDKLLGAEPPFAYGRFFSALLVGDKSGLATDDWQILQTTGTIHLMAISGLHIGLIAVWGYLCGGLLSRVCGLFAPLLQARVGMYLPVLFGVLFAAGYAALAGFSIPTIRALAACLVVSICRLLGVRLAPAMLLVLCALVVVCLEPLAWTSPGFWLSFTAVAVLMYTFAGRRHGKLYGLCKAQLVLGLGMLLPLLILGQATGLISPVANLFVVPVVSMVIIPGLLLAALLNPWLPALAQFIIGMLDWVFAGVWTVLSRLGQQTDLMWWPEHFVPAWLALLSAVAVVVILAPRGLQVRGLGGIILMACLFAYRPERADLQLTVLDVGQGLSVVIQTPGATWIYDAGPKFSEQFDAGHQIVLPYLRRLGVHEASMVVSHNDADHSGGLLGIARGIDFNRLIAGEPVALSDGNTQYCQAGQRWRSDHLQLTVMWPPPEQQMIGNDSSCVLLLELKNKDQDIRILLTGDINTQAEYYVMAHLDRPIDILVAPHHGSLTSSGPLFVRHLAPRWVIFSAGYKNRYNHPHPKVVDRYNRVGSTMLNTATDGAVTFIWKANSPPAIKKTRIEHAKPWGFGFP